MDDARVAADRARAAAGFTLVEMIATLAIAALLISSLAAVVSGALASDARARERSALAVDARLAMDRMVTAIGRSNRLVLPLAENPATGFSESLRDPGVLAVALDPELDRDADGVADADNDADGRVDEDMPADANLDGAPGLVGIDDDGDGLVDESAGGVGDDDEDGVADEDPLRGDDADLDAAYDEDAPADANGDGAPGVGGADDDGDAQVDEGPAGDDDEDGSTDEDWLDVVAYRLGGNQLLERMPDPAAADGTDFTERVIASHVSAFRVSRLPVGAGRAQLVELTLELTRGDATLELRSVARLGGAR